MVSIIAEFRKPVDLSFRHSLRAWRYGMSRFNYSIYGLRDSNNPKDYLSDLAMIKQRFINAKYFEIINNKLSFAFIFKYLGISTPAVKGMIHKGKILLFESGTTMTAGELMHYHMEMGSSLALKPIWGGHGTGFLKLTRNDQGFLVNDVVIPFTTLANMITSLDQYVITEYVIQAEYAAKLYEHTTNTLRIITLQDIASGGFFIAKAVHRIGTRQSHPVDNFKAGAGGLSAAVNHHTGELGMGALVDAKGVVSWHSHHPETKAPIEGVVVPRWSEIQATVLAYAAQIAFAPCIAWDVVLTETDFSIIEPNSMPGMPVLQVHGPFLDDPRIRSFYRHHGIVK